MTPKPYMNAFMPSNTSASTTSAVSGIAAAGRDTPRHRGKLLYKLLAVLLALSLVPLIWTAYILIHVGDRAIQHQIIDMKKEIAEKVATNVYNYLEDRRNSLQIVQKSDDFLTMDPKAQTEILGNVMNAYRMFMRLAVIDMDGHEISAVNRMGNAPSRQAHWDEAEALRSIRSMGNYLSMVSRSPEGYPQVTVGVPIERIPGRPIGVLMGVVNLLDLSSLVKGLVVSEHGYVYIVDMTKRQLIAHPDLDTLLGALLPPEVQAASLAPEDNPSGAIEFADQAGHKFLATYATVPQLNWRVFVQQPVREAYETLTEMKRLVSKVLILVVFITIFAAVALGQWIVKHVHTLQDAIEQVGEGNFDIPDVPISNDEFGSLTEKFLWMARILKDKTIKLMTAQQELHQWNAELERRVDVRTRDLKEAQDQLIAQEKLAALGQMASVVGHELRNPLAVMNNSVYFLKTKLAQSLSSDDGLDEKIAKHIRILEGEIVKSNAIIRDVLDFARNRALNAVPHKIDELVDQAIERIQIPPTVTLKKALTLGELEVPVDEDELRQVLVNLMENACQAMTSGGTLVVGTKTQGGFAEIMIGDTGCGIPQEHVNKIFAPFFTTKSRGTGLGLAVVKKIIDRHQGRIEVKSKVGEGTEFHILLPLKEVAHA